MTASRDAYIVLNRIEGIGPVRVKALCEALGSPEAVLGAPADVLSRVRGIGPKIAESLAEQAGRLDAASEEEKAARLGAKLVTPLDGGYPEPLRNIYDPPLCLYVAGEWRASDARALAVVGTRRMSKYGEAQTERLAAGIAKAGFTVVSGLARGVDTVAHRAALSAGGRTVAGVSCFCPQEPVSRAEFLVMAMELKGVPVDENLTASGFADAEEAAAWMQPYLASAMRRGLVSGESTEEGLMFRPNDPVTGQEAAVMLQNLLRLPITAAVIPSEDTSWAAASLQALREAGVALSAPEAPLTRQETACLLRQIADLP